MTYSPFRILADHWQDIYNRIRTIQLNKELYETLSHKTVFHEILQSNLPEREKRVERLWQEAQIFTFAGTETVAWTLSIMTFYLLSMPEVLQKLKLELNKAIPDATGIPEWKDLEQLPYLSAVIQESLRFSLGAATRQHRSCPDEAVVFDDGKKKWVIPPGTAIAMSTPIIHFNPKIFPEPHKFDPERWLKDPGLDKYMWSFSKGPRQCLGINLAYAELYLCTAALFRRYNGPSASKAEIKGDETGSIELFETTIDDVTFQRDMFAPYPKEGSKGVQILLK
jgi:cytochrome P450